MQYRGYTISQKFNKWYIYKWTKMIKGGFATDKEAREYVDKELAK